MALIRSLFLLILCSGIGSGQLCAADEDPHPSDEVAYRDNEEPAVSLARCRAMMHEFVRRIRERVPDIERLQKLQSGELNEITLSTGERYTVEHAAELPAILVERLSLLEELRKAYQGQLVLAVELAQDMGIMSPNS